MSGNSNSNLLYFSALGSAALVGSYLISRASNVSPIIETIRPAPQNAKSLKLLAKDSIIELCVSDIESILVAKRAEVNSVELCVNRSEGGVTPSTGLIEESVKVLRASNIAVHVLIRPRAGNFEYSLSEIELIQRDILTAKLAGADGIVIGALKADGTINKELMSVVRVLSEGMLLTFHRAFDVCTQDLESAVEEVISLGCDRILTSGRAVDVMSGRDTLRSTVQYARGRIAVVAGCGVNLQNVEELVRTTGVSGVHAGSSVTSTVDSRTASSGSFSGSDMAVWQCVDIAKARELVAKATSGWDGVSAGMASAAATETTPGASIRAGENGDEMGDDAITDAAGGLDREYVYLPSK